MERSSLNGFGKLRTAFLAVSIPLMAVALLASGLLRYQWLSSDMIEGLSGRMDRTSTRIAINMENPFWRFDAEYGRTILTTEMEDAAIQASYVFDKKDGSLFVALARGKDGLAPPDSMDVPEPGPGQYLINKDVTRDSEAVASLVLMYDDHEVRASVGELASRSLFEGLILLVLLGLLVSVLLEAQVNRPVSLALAKVRRLHDGDLSRDGRRSFKRDELGVLSRSMDEMTDRLRDVVMGVKEASDGVAASSSELSKTARQMTAGIQGVASSSQQLSQGATEQAASAEQVSASIEQMSANIKQNADNAQQTEKIAAKAAKDARDGAVAVKQSLSAMKSIAERIAIIEEIARQTNMLSLNASIEAARAGEHGKGFAVVASEVGKLAERSKKAAGEISEMTAQSLAVADKAGAMLELMVPDIGRTAELVQEISTASREQDTGTAQISKAITQLDSVIQHNASLSEEFGATSEEIAGQSALVAGTAAELAGHASRLRETVSFFRLDDNERLPVASAIPEDVASGF
ncbi:MAG: hypothetical protein KBB32_12505 [Spirochaetia bacterium]|nr:hypothetical protein [Spirochaetia bacterium]